MIFTTSYKTDQSKHIAQIYAKNKKECKRIIQIRNLNEKIIGWVKHSNVNPPPTDFNEKVHEACFLGYIGLKSKLLSLDEVLGDSGLLHQMAHSLQFNTVDRKEALYDVTLEKWRDLIPGYKYKK